MIYRGKVEVVALLVTVLLILGMHLGSTWSDGPSGATRTLILAQGVTASITGVYQGTRDTRQANRVIIMTSTFNAK